MPTKEKCILLHKFRVRHNYKVMAILIKFTRAGLQCNNSKQQTLNLGCILKYLSVSDLTPLCTMLHYVQYLQKLNAANIGSS